MKQVQEAVNQHVMVALPNGDEAPVLVADLNKDIEMVIISKNVLKYLTKLLPKASIRDIIMNHVGNCNALKYKEGSTIEEFVDVLREELEFHESINIIKEYMAEPKPIVDEAPEPAPTVERQ